MFQTVSSVVCNQSVVADSADGHDYKNQDINSFIIWTLYDLKSSRAQEINPL